MQEFVYIIEAPSGEDLYRHRYESDLLRQAIGLNDITCIVRMTVSKGAFEKAIREGLQQAIEANFPQDPILHISAHGSEEGILLTGKELLTWSDLKRLLLPLSQRRKYGLLLCMSTCLGLHARKMALLEKGEDYEPFYAVVGNSGNPTWSETAVAYASFYHFLSKGAMLGDAVEAMKAASGNKEFQILLAFVERNENRFGSKTS